MGVSAETRYRPSGEKAHDCHSSQGTARHNGRRVARWWICVTSSTVHRDFTSLVGDIDATPFMKGLPDDRCPCPHWGYVIKGKMTARYADRDEVFEAGDAFYTPPGHIPVANEPGTEFVSFSPSEELRTAEAVMIKNMQAMQGG